MKSLPYLRMGVLWRPTSGKLVGTSNLVGEPKVPESRIFPRCQWSVSHKAVPLSPAGLHPFLLIPCGENNAPRRWKQQCRGGNQRARMDYRPVGKCEIDAGSGCRRFAAYSVLWKDGEIIDLGAFGGKDAERSIVLSVSEWAAGPDHQ